MSEEMFEGKTAKQWHNDWLLERNGREQDRRERGLPLAWKRKCNDKLYGLDGVNNWSGTIMVWLRESGTNKALHLPLATLARCYRPVEGYQAVRNDIKPK